MRLPADAVGSSHDRPRRGRLVLVHGFTQTRSSWSTVASQLSHNGFEVVTVDAPGHGEAAGLRVDLSAGATLLGNTGERATYVGYSMGGRLALHLAVARPDLVERLVLVSSTAGIDDDDERAIRRAEDENRATDIERLGVAAFLDEWLAAPLFANLPPGATQRAARLQNTAAGLASSLRLAGTGAQESLWPRLRSLTMPVLLVAGALDAKFTAIVEQMAALIPGAAVVVVAGAGHVVHLEQPDKFVRELRGWLDSTAAGGTARRADSGAEGETERRQDAEGEL
jgi:2-succinyl-6-hydroxy-2,4-cyclohexadiene-1-carboxylate synthase